MFALIFPLFIAATVLADDPETDAGAAPIPQSAAVATSTAPLAATSVAIVPELQRKVAKRTDICEATPPADSKKPVSLWSPMDGFRDSQLFQPCTLAPNEFSVSMGYQNLTTLRGPYFSDRVFFPNALIEAGSVNPNLTYLLFVPTYSPGHAFDGRESDGFLTTFRSEPANSDLAFGGTYRFDNRESRFALGFTGVAIVPTSTRGSGTQALGGITSIDAATALGQLLINVVFAERFTTGSISPISPYSLLSGRGPSDEDCDDDEDYGYGSGYGSSEIRLRPPDDRDKEYSTFNPSLSVGSWLPIFPSDPTFLYGGASYFSQTSADPESARTAYHLGIVQPIVPHLSLDVDWGLAPSTDTSRTSQHALSTNLTYRF